jgi:hypothetical protein
MKLKSITGSLLAAAGVLLANPASADLEFLGLFNNVQGQLNYEADTLRADLTCASCSGIVTSFPSTLDVDGTRPNSTDADGISNVAADMFVNEFGVNPTDETTFAEALILGGTGNVVDLDQGVQIDMGGAADTDFCSSSVWILFKVGQRPDYALVQNTSGGEQCFDYSAVAGTGSGLSHITVFGGETRVSEPSILALFGAGLLLLGFLRRRTIV